MPRIQVDHYTIQIWRDIGVTEIKCCNSDSVQHSLLSFSSISGWCSIHKSTTMQFGLDLDSEGYHSWAYNLLGSCTDFVISTSISLQVQIESKLHWGQLMCGALSTYTSDHKIHGLGEMIRNCNGIRLSL